MSSITIVRRPERIVIASDGAGYGDDGRLLQLRSKVDLFPHAGFVVGHVGTAPGPMFFASLLAWLEDPVLTFDMVVQQGPALANEARARAQRQFGPHDRFRLLLAGWSDERARFETYSLRAGEDVVPLPGVFCCPEPHASIGAPFGWVMPGPEQEQAPADDVQFALRAVIATRFTLGNDDAASAESDPQCCVGGFLQLTIVERETVWTRIVHRWPDVIGERMVPHHGAVEQQMPGWLLSPSAAFK